MGVVRDVVDCFNRKHYGIAEIGFAEIEEHDRLERKAKYSKAEKMLIAESIAKAPIKIVDTIGS